MLLTIDVGNTYLSLGLFLNKKIKEVSFFHTKKFMENNESLESLKVFKNSKISHVIICSVVDEVNYKLLYFLKKKNLQFTFLNKNIELLDIKTSVKGHIGVDRLVNIFYCLKHFKVPFLIIDLGTATTFDYVNNKQVYEGGIILPGIDISLKSLEVYTSKLPSVKFKKKKKIISNNTEDAITSGFYWGYLSMIEGIIKKVRREKSSDFNVVLTGGNCEYYKNLSIFHLIDKYLTIKGLNLIYKHIFNNEQF